MHSSVRCAECFGCLHNASRSPQKQSGWALGQTYTLAKALGFHAYFTKGWLCEEKSAETPVIACSRSWKVGGWKSSVSRRACFDAHIVLSGFYGFLVWEAFMLLQEQQGLT